MRWIETIKVQSATGKEQAVENELIVLAREAQKSLNCQGIQEAIVSRHASVPGHLAIRLYWDTECPQIQGSLLGLSLAQSLRDFGLVDHSVWIENRRIQEGKENEKENY